MTTSTPIAIERSERVRQAASLLAGGDIEERRTLAERLFTERFQLLGPVITFCVLGHDPLDHEGLDAFSDRTAEVTEIKHGGDLVTVRMVFRGVHRGRFQGRSGRGERRTASGLALLLFEGERIDRIWMTLHWDVARSEAARDVLRREVESA